LTISSHMQLSSALRLYQKQSNDAQIAFVLHSIAHGRILADEIDATQEYAQRSLEISQRTGDPFGTAEARNLAAKLALMNGDLQAAIGHLEWAYGFWRTHDRDHTGLAQARLLPWCYFFAGAATLSPQKPDTTFIYR
jgi:hypothetical protein